MITLDEFRATRVWSDDLAAAVRSDNWAEKETPKGWLYLGCLYIEQVQPYWPEATRKCGAWHLMIGRNERISDDLPSLEQDLYNFATSEGLTDPAASQTDLESQFDPAYDKH